MVPFDYGEPAELYFPVLLGRRGGLDYRRFPTAALALQYAIETLAAEKLGSATLEVAGVRYDRVAMRRLYEAHSAEPTAG
jgi:hypothetical protein